jgi:hypothetical protein
MGLMGVPREMEMQMTKMFGVCAVLVSTLVACARPAPDADTPEIANDTLVTADEGTAYNGWNQSAGFSYEPCYDDTWYFQSMGGTGDASRGGGVCALSYNGTSCSNDSTCVSIAQSQYGASAYGYCYAGACYSRPGSQASWCTMSPNRASGSWLGNEVTQAQVNTYNLTHAVGCMTKTAGPNTACGGTNASLYMRTMATYTVWYTPPCD